MSETKSTEQPDTDGDASRPGWNGRRRFLLGTGAALVLGGCEILGESGGTSTTTTPPYALPPPTIPAAGGAPTTLPVTTTTIRTPTTIPGVTSTLATTPSVAARPTTSTTTPPPPARPPRPPKPTTVPPAGGDGPPVPMVMSRLSYGYTPELRTEIETVGWEAWVDQQPDPWSIEDDVAQNMLTPLSSITATNAVNRLRIGLLPDVVDEMRHANVLRARYSKRQVYELMVEFWSDHFNIGAEGKSWAFCKATDEAVYRAHALGKFSDLLLGSARSVAMLLYLDNARSDYDDGVNENYGRELLELHTLGIIDGVQAYTEEDVMAAAHVMAGWGVNWTSYTFEFKSYAHSPEAHQLLGGKWQRPARPARDGEQDGVSMLNFLAHHPSTA